MAAAVPHAGSGKLEVFSWWTSGSESAALDTLFNGFKAKDPGAEVVNAAVSGGGGSNARQALATRLQGGDPPDSWQLHPDQDLAEVVKDGSVADLTDLYTENGWQGKLPEQIDKMLQVDGKYYAVPVNAHRANVLWTNPAVLQQAGVTWNEDTTLDQFVADLPKFSGSGVTALCLGDKDIFASVAAARDRPDQQARPGRLARAVHRPDPVRLARRPLGRADLRHPARRGQHRPHRADLGPGRGQHDRRQVRGHHDG